MRGRRGLTLLEVLVAMTVLAVGIAAVLGALSACLRGVDAADGYSRGALLAQQVAAELERSDTLEAGTLAGTFDDTGPGYTWTADVQAADAQGQQPVQITVRWDAGRRAFPLTTILHPHPLPGPARPTDPTGPTGPTGPPPPEGDRP